MEQYQISPEERDIIIKYKGYTLDQLALTIKRLRKEQEVIEHMCREIKQNQLLDKMWKRNESNT